MSNFVIEVLAHPYGGSDILMETIRRNLNRVNDRKCWVVEWTDRERYMGADSDDLFASLVTRKEPGTIIGHLMEERAKKIEAVMAAADREDVLLVESSPHILYHVWNIAAGGYYRDQPGYWIADRKYEDNKWVPVSAIFSVESSLTQVSQ